MSDATMNAAPAAAGQRRDALFYPRVVSGHFARACVALVLGYAAIEKLKDLGEFAKQVRQYHVAPEMWTEAIANIVPWFELATVALLLLGLWRFEARLLILGMMVWFTALKLTVYMQGREIECGCFGKSLLSEWLKGGWGIVLNLALIALLLYDWWTDRQRSTIASKSAG
ncbi:MAG: hypothetical protein JNG88_06385 [Phycisphaerales bacterium]|nr:hypothetical protein [Phycisphaerales bacterium]